MAIQENQVAYVEDLFGAQRSRPLLADGGPPGQQTIFEPPKGSWDLKGKSRISRFSTPFVGGFFMVSVSLCSESVVKSLLWVRVCTGK
jgi:hypothetical protein